MPSIYLAEGFNDDKLAAVDVFLLVTGVGVGVGGGGETLPARGLAIPEKTTPAAGGTVTLDSPFV